MRVVLGESHFAALISRRPIKVQFGVADTELHLELVLASISPERLLEIHLQADHALPARDPPEAREFLPARRRPRKARTAP